MKQQDCKSSIKRNKIIKIKCYQPCSIFIAVWIWHGMDVNCSYRKSNDKNNATSHSYCNVEHLGFIHRRDRWICFSASWKKWNNLPWYNYTDKSSNKTWNYCEIEVKTLWSGTMIKKSFPFFPSILRAYSLNIQLAKFWALCFIQRLFILSVSFGFHGLTLFTLKTDR